MVQATQLHKTGRRLRKHAEHFAAQTRSAGVEFFFSSREATVEFANEINDASSLLVRQTSRSTTDLSQALVDEAKVLADLTRAAGRDYTERLRTRLVPARIMKKTPAGGGATVPIKNYDDLTAKDVVARIQRLSGPKASAVLDYERSRKKRATVIRAAEQRLKAAG